MYSKFSHNSYFVTGTVTSYLSYYFTILCFFFCDWDSLPRTFPTILLFFVSYFVTETVTSYLSYYFTIFFSYFVTGGPLPCLDPDWWGLEWGHVSGHPITGKLSYNVYFDSQSRVSLHFHAFLYIQWKSAFHHSWILRTKSEYFRKQQYFFIFEFAITSYRTEKQRSLKIC